MPCGCGCLSGFSSPSCDIDQAIQRAESEMFFFLSRAKATRCSSKFHEKGSESSEVIRMSAYEGWCVYHKTWQISPSFLLLSVSLCASLATRCVGSPVHSFFNRRKDVPDEHQVGGLCHGAKRLPSPRLRRSSKRIKTAVGAKAASLINLLVELDIFPY